MGKSYDKSGLHFYLGGGALDFIGYKNEKWIIGLIKTSTQIVSKSCCGFPVIVLVAGLFLNALVSIYSGQTKFKFNQDMCCLAIGAGLTFAWSLVIPERFNPFVWKTNVGMDANRIINLNCV